ncbi:MAG: 3-phosphoshikimate 1-carboxyvinyltransferase [Ruminococcaceae bacterium]|nr:3-phosphoshikimate 1-carboxyvinyltransferase [Oscillospiraceae bacterium]
MNIKIMPGKISGTIKAIPSKSDAHRLMIANYLAGGAPLKLEWTSKDIDATNACLKALDSGDVLSCGESGSTARFILPVAAALKEETSLTGQGRLTSRPFKELCDAMRENGASFDRDLLPMTVKGKLKSGTYELPGNVSSQYISGLLFATPLLDGDSIIKLTTPLESVGYVNMTMKVLGNFGIKVEQGENYYKVPGGQKYILPETVAPEGDWSNSAFWLAAGINVTGLDENSYQGDKAIVKILEDAKISGDLHIDVKDIPDLVPVISVIASGRQGTTYIENAARLRIKESDRIKTVCEMINNLGGCAKELPEGLIIEGTGSLKGGTVDSANDHRIVMATAIASTICKEPVIITDAGAVDKSYPTFFEDFEKLGGHLNVI